MGWMATRIKHCGITNLEDAHRAAEAGAWALGMIFWDRSPRRCELAEAQVIGAALRRTVHLCGVFVNATLEAIAAAVRSTWPEEDERAAQVAEAAAAARAEAARPSGLEPEFMTARADEPEVAA